MPTKIKKSKRRRHIRFPIELEAVLIVEKAITLPCLILDFCSGGLFLGLEPSSPEILLDQLIKIRFAALGTESSRENFEINARAVNITPTGIGVAVDHMPVSVFNALTNAANAGSITEVNERRSSTPNKINQENCKKAFKRWLIEKLPPLLGQFFESLREDLEKASQHVDYLANSSQLDDLITTLQLNRETFVSEFCSSVISQVDGISEPHQKTENIMTTHNELSLIDEENFEDWLEISSIIRKLNDHFEDSFTKLIQEFARVFGQSITLTNNPVSPAVLCDSFREVVLSFELSNKINSTLYHSFEKLLINGLVPLYEQATLLLLKYERADTKAAYSPYQPHKAAGKPKPKPEPYQSLLFDKQQSLPAFESFKQKSLQPITQITGKLLALLNKINAVTPEAVQRGLPRGETVSESQTDSCYSAEDVLNALSNIQNTHGDNESLHWDSIALNQRLQDTLDSLTQGTKSLANDDRQQLEIYGKFFETLFHDFEFSTDIKAYLEKIHLPLLSLSLQGNDFLDDETHPARAILNQLAALESAVKGDKAIGQIKVKQALNRLIDRIVHEASTNPEILTEVEHELDEISKRVSQSTELKIKRIIDAHEEQQKREIVERSVQQTIDQRMAGSPLPAIIPHLLKSGWQQLLVNAELNQKKHPDEKLKYLEVLENLIFWYYEPDAVRKIQAGSIKKTLEFIQENLKSVCHDVLQRRDIITELTALLLGGSLPKSSQRLESARIEPDKPVVPMPDDHCTLQVEQLNVGEWLMMSSGSAGFEAMKLVWIGAVVQVYVFVNHDGMNALEVGKSELANLLRRGAAHKIESLDTPLMDRATHSMLQKMHGELLHNATHDLLTGLFTRDEFVRQLKHEITKLDDSNHMLCHLEVLDLRDITNICGVDGSEQLLKKLVQLMAERLQNDELFGRLGHKSFAILFKHCSADEGHEKSKKLMKLISDTHFQWQDKSFAFGVSMGLVPFMDTCLDVQELLQQADTASLSAERSSQNRILLFTNEDENLKRLNKLYEWIGHIDDVLAKNRLFVRCQMIAPIEQDNNDHLHYEILLGIRDEAGEIVPPDHFIPAVERCQRMPEIDQWIIVNVFSWIEKNRPDFDQMDGFSINLSGQSINSEAFLEFLKEKLESSDFPVEKLTFEITETVASENIAFTKRFIKTIKQLGCKFSLDDFGSGYSSYSYLKNLNVDYLKIDGAFVKDMVNNPADIAIVKSMNEIAHSLGLKTIAEYVENNEIREILKEIGVDYGQGYGIHKPMPLTELLIPTASTSPCFFEDNSFWDF